VFKMRSIVQYCQKREQEERSCYKFQRELQVNDSFMRRLGLDAELQGHTGCVNCLEWNEKGDLLVSGSDDVHIALWDPFRHKRLHNFQSGHHGNIFSVKFLPNSNDNVLVSGAADCKIRVHDVNAEETTYVCSCHTGRVKRLAVAPNIPFMFWSAAEDGTIMQFDLRVPHTCSSACSNVLISLLHHMGKSAEAKCIAINPLQPELLAVGANDPFIRLYDRRMISPTTIQSTHLARSSFERHSSVPRFKGREVDNLPPGCVQYYVAGHLPQKQQDYKKRNRTLASTYVTFGPNGRELLVNLGGEQIYLFDISKPLGMNTFDIQRISALTAKNGCNGSYSNGVTHSIHRCSDDCSSGEWISTQASSTKNRSPPLHARAEALKLQANSAFEKQQFTLAINLYNSSLEVSPNSAVLYGNRAAAYMKRGWDGDLYAALRDCNRALEEDPNSLKAHFRLSRCLYELQWIKEAADCLQIFKTKYPEHAQSNACEALDRDIKAANFSKTPDSEDSSSTSGDGSSSNPVRSKRRKKPSLSDQEKAWRRSAYDYQLRYCGHCNTTTDIKEANFFGSNGQYIIAGSDDGSFFVWNKKTTNIVRVLRGDDSIVNCLQPHPSSCLLATSGIDPVVRLWSPRAEDGIPDDREVLDSEDAAIANQKRMNADPLEVMLLNMGYRIRGDLDTDEEGDWEQVGRETSEVHCRPS